MLHVVKYTNISYHSINYLLTRRRLCHCSFCVCVICEQDYLKSNESISFKLGVMIRHTNRKNRLTFGAAPVPDMDIGSIFHYPHHCGIVDFRRFISISHTVTAQFLRNLAMWLMPTRKWIHNIFGRNLANIWYFWLKFWCWQRFVLSKHSLFTNVVTADGRNHAILLRY